MEGYYQVRDGGMTFDPIRCTILTFDPSVPLLDVLLYLTDAMLPLVMCFYNDFFEPHNRPWQLVVTGKVLTALLVSVTL